MIRYQRIIKYCALAFAVLLIFNIFSWFYFVISSFLETSNKDLVNYEEMDILESVLLPLNIYNLKIDTALTNILFQTGEIFKIETDNNNVEIRNNGNEVTIKENSSFWKSRRKNNNLLITIPSDYILEEVEIDSSASNINIVSLNAHKLDLDLGTGDVIIESLNVLKKAEIDGGTGDINIKSGTIYNLDLDLGIGDVVLSSNIVGNSNIDAGVGKVSVELAKNIEDYRIKVNKGIGNVTVAGENAKDGMIFGNGSNTIDINGGIGVINVEFSY